MSKTNELIDKLIYIKDNGIMSDADRETINEVCRELKRLERYENGEISEKAFEIISSNVEKNTQKILENLREDMKEIYDTIASKSKVIAEYKDKIERGELVEVVRCNDCIKSQTFISNKNELFCTVTGDRVKLNHYCGFAYKNGERSVE